MACVVLVGGVELTCTLGGILVAIRARLSMASADSSNRFLAGRKRTAWPARAIELLVCGCVLLPGLFYPLARDQGLFAYSGQVILDGGVPYQDLYEQKGPATHYTFALALALFGESVLAMLKRARIATRIPPSTPSLQTAA